MINISHRNNLLLIVGAILLCAFAGSSYLNYRITKTSVHDEIVKTDLPLTMSNIYSEITSLMTKPLLVSSSMASDTFLKDWILAGEYEHDKVTQYLSEIKNEYGFFTAFFVSGVSQNYYRYDGLHKIVSQKDNHDDWYFNFVNSEKDYEYNVDTDEGANHALTIFLNYRVMYNNLFLGVVGVGLKVESVAENIAKYQLSYDRIVYLTDKSGVIQLHPNIDLVREYSIKELPGIKNIAPNLLQQTEDSRNYEFTRDGEHILLNVKYIPTFDWLLYVEQSRTKALATARKNIMQTMGIGFLSTLIIIFITLTTINRYQKRLEASATTDELTGALNRRALDTEFSKFSSNFIRTDAPFCALLIDLDRFKEINDTLGHLAGDKILADITSVMTQIIRPTDCLARWGGDEFVVLSDTNLSEGVTIAERIRHGVEEYIKTQNYADNDPRKHISISCGISQFYNNDTLDKLILRADQAMYRCKEQGGNKVSI